MCGITALLRARGAPAVPAGTLLAMTDRVAHRGPDGSGTVFLGGAGAERTDESSDWRVALGHRRLSILDLSDAGRQPMRRGEQLWITYNGEVFDYVEVAETLSRHGHRFESRSDTEVILAAYEHWGPSCFEHMRGMWGLVLVDGRRRKAVLCRDRLGIKPLYLHRRDGLLAVVSEIKQLQALPGAIRRPDRDALAMYLDSGYEDSSRTFFEDVQPFPPATWMEVDLDTLEAGAPQPYWWPERVEPHIEDRDEAGRVFADAFRRSVQIHLRSDVPVGCALSGGLDSSAIAAVVNRIREPAAPPLHTFTVTFPGDPSDERVWVDALLRTVAAEPHFVTPTAEAFLQEVRRFAWIHDEPVGSLSQYAGWCVARLTREAGVPVTLNGQGGDEVLAGYWQSYFAYLQGLLRTGHPLRFASHFGGALTPGGNPELPRQVPTMLRRYGARRSGGSASREKVERVLGMNDAERRVYEIREMYLPRLLKWDDRNFMAFSVEGRYPFLDHVVIEAALAIRPRALYDRGWIKEPIRRGLAAELPREISRRRTKAGFPTPQSTWLRGVLRPAIASAVRHNSALSEHLGAETRAPLEESMRSDARTPETDQALLRYFLADSWFQAFFC